MLLIKRLFFILITFLCFFNMTCEDDIATIDCDQTVIVNQDLYDDLESDSFSFEDIEIVGDCLSVKIGASGCDGNSWEFELVDSGVIAESLPEQRYLKLQLANSEDCLAFVERTMSFDLTPLQMSNGLNEVILHIEGLESSIHYKY